MKAIARQKRKMTVFNEIERKLGTQRDMFKREWSNRRYDYYCGDWRNDWHEERKVNEANTPKFRETLISPDYSCSPTPQEPQVKAVSCCCCLQT